MAMSLCGQLGCMVRRFRSTSPSSSPLPLHVHLGVYSRTVRVVNIFFKRFEHFFGGGVFSTYGVSPSISRAFSGPCNDCVSGLGLSAPYLRRSDRPRRRGAAVQHFRRKVPCDRAPRHRRLPRLPRNDRRSAHALRSCWRGLSAIDVRERRAVPAVGGRLPRQLRGWAPPPPLPSSPALWFEPCQFSFLRVFSASWGWSSVTASCAVQAPFATSAAATSAGSLRRRWKAHGRRSMRPLCRPSTWSPCASCSTAPAPLSSAISSSGSSSALPEPPFTPARPPALAYRRCLRAAAHEQTDPAHNTDATHLPTMARTPAARGGTADVLGRRRVRTGECGRASAARWRARARALSCRSGCPRLCVPRHAPR